ncbi:MAG: VCBS repeat-containing protein [Planctomycetes bacterium]|nr:VCBS repeat-containing protein [Planctomycetota bacterium]
MFKSSLVSTFTLVVLLAAVQTASAEPIALRSQEIAKDLTVGYAVSLCDVNGDKKTDIVVVDSDRVLWYENPTWQPQIIIKGQTKRDNVCIAPYDIDGDGQLDFALGADWRPADTKTGGTIQWLRRSSAGSQWEVRQIAEEPTTHRMRWVDVDGDGRSELVVLPLFGRDTTKPNFAEQGVRVLAFRIPADPVADRWPMVSLNDEMHVTHNFWPTDLDGDQKIDLLVTSFEGVNLLRGTKFGPWRRTRIGEGNQTSTPNRGASEIKRGRLKNGADYIATIEPWHGFEVLVYTRPESGQADGMWRRQVLDDQLQWGHAVWCADMDGDGDEELLIGVRDNKNEQIRSGLRIYDPQDTTGQKWERHLYEPGEIAIEDLAAADLNGDGRPDIVASGRQTKNVRIYWNEIK